MTIVALDQSPLDELAKTVAEKELRETPAIKEEAIRELRRILAEDTTLNYDDSDEFLQMILRPVKFYPESAFQLLQRIADFREKHAKVLQNVSPLSEKDSFFNTRVLNVLVDRDQHQRRILTMCMGKPWDTRVMDTDKLFRALYLIHFGALMEPKTQVHGTVIIMDFTGLSYSQAMAFTPAFSHRLLTFIQSIINLMPFRQAYGLDSVLYERGTKIPHKIAFSDAMPLRLKAVHIIFQPMIHFHNNNVQSLHKHIDPSCLPSKYGGTRGEIDYSGADWYPVLAEFEEKIKGTEIHSGRYGTRMVTAEIKRIKTDFSYHITDLDRIYLRLILAIPDNECISEQNFHIKTKENQRLIRSGQILARITDSIPNRGQTGVEREHKCLLGIVSVSFH
ncbi:hypothetical protein ACFE04_008276 [Oxalis oulophora]